MYYFSRNIFLLLYYINWLNFIVWLPLLLEILAYMCIVIICSPVCDIINFGITHSFLNKPFFYITKKFQQNLSISRTKRAINIKAVLLQNQKVFFYITKKKTLRFSEVFRGQKNGALGTNGLRNQNKDITLFFGPLFKNYF